MEENRVKAILKSFFTSRGFTLKGVVDKYNEVYPENKISLQSLSNKLARGSIKFSEVIDLMDVIGYQICFKEKYRFTCKSNKSLNFRNCVIMGEYVDEAEIWLKSKINGKSISKSDEMLLMYQACELFNVGFFADNGTIQIFDSEEQKQQFESFYFTQNE